MFFDDADLGAKRSKRDFQKRKLIVAIERVLIAPVLFTDAELMAMPTGSRFVFDVESYPNYFCIAFKSVDTGKIVYFEDSPSAKINTEKLLWMLWHFCIIGFNSNVYDVPMVFLAAAEYNAAALFEATKQIIQDDARPGEIEKTWGITIHCVNHIDLIEVAPLDASLKLYAGRLHCSRLQDLPFAVGTYLTEDQARTVLYYCCTDLDNTESLYRELCPQIDLREALGREYGQDLRSRSDSQIAEAVINSEIAKLNGFFPRRPRIAEGTKFQYNMPGFIKFASPQLQAAADAIARASFEVDGLGSPKWPQGLGVPEKNKQGKTVWVLKVKVDGETYKLGMGGLHSVEKCAGHVATDSVMLIDRDVASYYPRIILNQRLYPKHLGPGFLTVYEGIVNKRLDAKKSGNKVVADSLKITINGSFGKLGNKYSTLYAPDLLLQVTITGQLCLLMLIEMVTAEGIPVVSGNTDGIVIKCPVERYEDLNRIVAAWEAITNFETEETRYAALYSRDVNNYIALKLKFDKKTNQWTKKPDGCKTKGVYSEVGSALNSVLSKNPETLICSDAVQALLNVGTPIEKTILECRDIRRFVAVRRVKGGAEKDGVYLGKVVRWYYAADEVGEINYVETGNKVPKSEGAKPLMDLPPAFPDDVNYDWYINETTDMLYDLGYYVKKQDSLFV